MHEATVLSSIIKWKHVGNGAAALFVLMLIFSFYIDSINRVSFFFLRRKHETHKRMRIIIYAYIPYKKIQSVIQREKLRRKCNVTRYYLVKDRYRQMINYLIIEWNIISYVCAYTEPENVYRFRNIILSPTRARASR